MHLAGGLRRRKNVASDDCKNSPPASIHTSKALLQIARIRQNLVPKPGLLRGSQNRFFFVCCRPCALFFKNPGASSLRPNACWCRWVQKAMKRRARPVPPPPKRKQTTNKNPYTKSLFQQLPPFSAALGSVYCSLGCVLIVPLSHRTMLGDVLSFSFFSWPD